MGWADKMKPSLRPGQMQKKRAPSTPESETEHERAVKAVVARLKSDGLCGEVFVDGFGQEVICILEAPCERHATHTEPPADRDAVAEIEADLHRMEVEISGSDPRFVSDEVRAITRHCRTLLALLRPEGEPTPEKLREWADWFDDVTVVGGVCWEQAPNNLYTAGFLLRRIADEFAAISHPDTQEDG